MQASRKSQECIKIERPQWGKNYVRNLYEWACCCQLESSSRFFILQRRNSYHSETSWRNSCCLISCIKYVRVIIFRRWHLSKTLLYINWVERNAWWTKSMDYEKFIWYKIWNERWSICITWRECIQHWRTYHSVWCWAYCLRFLLIFK